MSEMPINISQELFDSMPSHAMSEVLEDRHTVLRTYELKHKTRPVIYTIEVGYHAKKSTQTETKFFRCAGERAV